MSKIDVSSCHADKTEFKDGLWCFWEAGKCENNPDCYFKQLQQLKEENEKLKEQLKAYTKPDVVEALTFYITGEFDIVEQRLAKAEQKLEKIEKFILQENKANRDLDENGNFIYGTILQIVRGNL